MKLRMLNPAARVRSATLGASVRTLGAAPAVKRALDFYGSAEWKALLRRIIKARGRRCQDTNCKTPDRGEGRKIYGDHIIELRDGGAPLDERNVMLMCPSCHGRKTVRAREERAGREAKADATMLHCNSGGRQAESSRKGSAAQGASRESGPNPGTFFSPGGRR